MAFTRGTRPEPPPLYNNQYEKDRIRTPDTKHRWLFDDVPRITSADAIQWYQYHKGCTDCTYPAKWCWDIEGQWLQFQKHYAQNPQEAETNYSQFTVGPNDNEIIDILNMKVSDKQIGMKHELKRTNVLIGTLLEYGHIGFNGDIWSGTFLYDRNTGYHQGVSENKLDIGDKVEFHAFWNKNDDDCFIYNVHTEMLAFNVRRVYVDEQQEKEAKVSETFDEHNANENVLQFTTPELNALPLPPPGEAGRIELSKRVQTKLNKMMNINEFVLDSQWKAILILAADSKYYNTQTSAWNLMKNLEQRKIRDKPVEVRKGLAQMSLEQSNIHNVSPVVSFYDEHQNDQIIPVISGIAMTDNGMTDAGDYATDTHGLPMLDDPSKYKVVLCEFCTKKNWVRPSESFANDGDVFRATVSFGKQGNEEHASGTATTKKNAKYEAYRKLVQKVIPIQIAKELMINWVSGHNQNKAVIRTIIGDTRTGQSLKHPKSVLLEWAQRERMAAPVTSYVSENDCERNMTIWTAIVKFGGKTVKAKSKKKKDAESKCCQQLLILIKNEDIAVHKQ